MTTSLLLLVLAALGRTAGLAPNALDLDVGETSRAEALAWARRGELRCEQRAAGRWMHCTDVPAHRLGEADTPEVDELDLHFDGRGRLWKATLRRDGELVDEGAAHFLRVTDGFATRLGPARDAIGTARLAARERSVWAYAGESGYARIVISRRADGRVNIMEVRSCRS
jgi:hypothetical protein